jgi:hypothetical protein
MRNKSEDDDELELDELELDDDDEDENEDDEELEELLLDELLHSISVFEADTLGTCVFQCMLVSALKKMFHLKLLLLCIHAHASLYHANMRRLKTVVMWMLTL